jgi:hypothetical protein
VKTLHNHYTLATKKPGGPIMINMGAVELIEPARHDGFTRLGIKAKGTTTGEWLIVDVGHNDAHCFIEYFNKHFKDKTMNKLSDFIDFTAVSGAEVKLYAQDIMRADMLADHGEDAMDEVKLVVTMQNGRTRSWMLGATVGQLVQDWLNSHSEVLAAAHAAGISTWLFKTPSVDAEVKGERDLGAEAGPKRAETPGDLSENMQQVYGTVEARLGELYHMAYGDRLFNSHGFRNDFVKALVLSIGTVARAIAMEECCRLEAMLTGDDSTPDEDAEAAKFFASKLGVPVDEVHVVRIDAGEAPEGMIDALRKMMKRGATPDGQKLTAHHVLGKQAFECLGDLLSHRDDFLRAIRTMKAIAAANDEPGDADYWNHQEKVLMRMCGQAKFAADAHNEAVKVTS